MQVAIHKTLEREVGPEEKLVEQHVLVIGDAWYRESCCKGLSIHQIECACAGQDDEGADVQRVLLLPDEDADDDETHWDDYEDITSQFTRAELRRYEGEILERAHELADGYFDDGY